MFFDCTVPIPEQKGKIYKRVIKDVTYINYEYDRIYKPEKKYNIPKRTTIGKQCKDDPTLMFPNQNFLKYFPDAELPSFQEKAERSCCLRIGTFLIVQKIAKDSMLETILSGIYHRDQRGYGLFLDLAAYSLITEGNAGQYFPDYAYNHPLFTPDHKIYSDSTVSRFLNEIDIEASVEFQNEWNEIKDHREKVYISYDSTNKNCQAGDIDLVEFGHAKDDKGLPIFNYSIVYDTKNREPLFYEEYPGSIVDVSQLQDMLDMANGYGYKHAAFILDRGYFSRANIRYMDQCGYDFVIMVKGMKPLVSEIILEEKGTFEDKWNNRIGHTGVNGTTVKRMLFASDEKIRYLHLFFSSSKCASERDALETKLENMEKNLKRAEGRAVTFDSVYDHYFYLEYHHPGKEDETFVCGHEKSDVIERELKLCGYFCIITSEEMTAKEAYELYKSRDASEKLFRTDKSFIGDRSERIYSAESLSGKILVEFAALIIRNRIYAALKDAEKEMDSQPNYMTVPAAIRELEKIEMVRQGDGIYRLDHAVTATQKVILKAFGLNAVDVKRKASEISEQLKMKKASAE